MGKVFAHARVSMDAQDLDPQTDELRKDWFDVLVVEKASGASRTRPELARLVREMKADDVLNVVRIDRLARSASHLLEVIETAGTRFRSSFSVVAVISRQQNSPIAPVSSRFSRNPLTSIE